MLVALLLLDPAHAIDLDLAGACPGDVTLTVSGATPDAGIGVASARGLAFHVGVVPDGPCVLTPLDLASRTTTHRGTPVADAAGEVVVEASIPGHLCSHLVQAVDLATCEVSRAKRLGGPPPAGDLVVASGRAGAAGTGMWSVDLDSGAVVPVASMARPLTGLTYAPDGTLWGAASRGYASDAELVRVDPSTGDQSLVATSAEWSWSGLAALPDGRLFAWTQASNALFEVDVETGALSGPVAAGPSYAHCMAADADGRLFRLVGPELFRVDPDAGTDEWLGVLHPFADGYQGAGCAFHDGLLYAAPMGTFDRELHAIDVDTLAVVETGIHLPMGIDAMASPTP